MTKQAVGIMICKTCGCCILSFFISFTHLGVALLAERWDVISSKHLVQRWHELTMFRTTVGLTHSLDL